MFSGAIRWLHPVRETELQQKLSNHLAESGDREDNQKLRLGRNTPAATDVNDAGRAAAETDGDDGGSDIEHWIWQLTWGIWADICVRMTLSTSLNDILADFV